MIPIDFGGWRSKVKVTMDIYGNKLVNKIGTKLLRISSSNKEDILAIERWWTLLISEVKGQGHIWQLVNTVIIETKPLCASSSNLADILTIWWEVTGQSSRSMDMYRNKLVNTMETNPLYASSSNLINMFNKVRGWTLLILEVTGQRWRSQWASLTNTGCAGMRLFVLLYFLSDFVSNYLV